MATLCGVSFTTSETATATSSASRTASRGVRVASQARTARPETVMRNGSGDEVGPRIET